MTSELSNLDALERKITSALEKLASMKAENKELRDAKSQLAGRVDELSRANGELRRNLEALESHSRGSQADGTNLESLRTRVDAILSKFDQLDL
ncbi:MAG: cell division protein ZapB [Candidatus Krumholzibacteriota bacterium]|nr:cell division protein ZapB [Candidatus Krumholzibacteriota bacterium]